MRKLRKYLAYMLAILKGRVTGRRIPVFVTLCLTNRCNLRCIYCYEHYYPRDFPDVPTADILSLVDQLHAAGTRYVSLNGGEVLLRDDIRPIIERVNQKGMLSHLSTNGLLAGRHLEALRQVDSVAISLDGRPAENDANRGKNVYDRVIETLSLLKANRIGFHTHTVLTRNNPNAIDDVMAIASRFGFKAQFSLLRITDSFAKDINLSDDEMRAALRRLIELKHAGRPVFFSTGAYRDAMNWPLSFDVPFIAGRKVPGYSRCYLKDFSCHIEANGMVYPCVTLVNKFKALNYREVGFQKAWDNLATCDCSACYSVCCNDLNRIFSLKPGPILNAADLVVKGLLAPKPEAKERKG